MKKTSKSKTVKRPARSAGTPANGKLRVVYSEQKLHKRVHELADQINRDYKGKTLHVVGVLENCFMFMADLIRAINVPVFCYFLRTEIKDVSRGGTATREIAYTPAVDATGKDILLVEGILQSGMTMDHLFRYFLGQNPSSVRTAMLIEKTDERKIAVPTDYVGFKTTGSFLVGYGLGYQGRYKNLPSVATLG